MLCPGTMMETLWLDNLLEDKIIAQLSSKSTIAPFNNIVSQRPPIMPAPRTTPIKHFSKAKIRTCKEKVLCYNCDEKFTQGDQCVEKNLYLLDVASLPTLEICEATQNLVDDHIDI